MDERLVKKAVKNNCIHLRLASLAVLISEAMRSYPRYCGNSNMLLSFQTVFLEFIFKGPVLLHISSLL